ncbi:N-acetyltransferase [Streptomyces sp. G44]|nr:N-acetyltransferase [Streptomyces sp. G44]
MYGRRIVGRLDYEVCEECASGVVTHAQVSGPLQDSGLGTRAVSHLRAYYPDVAWHSRLTRRLARDLARRMRLPQGFAGPCTHLRPASPLASAAHE